uniref:Filamin-C-like n=1 Tax=Cynoglossus semilaevis TaxID=244447 RepID=A0A3P8V7A8_CYNSE
MQCPEGYKITYTPMAPGNYLITIKYGGPQHIVGSPFKAKITGWLHSRGHSLHETSSVLVETVTKSSKVGGAYSASSTSSSTKLSSDASKVVCRGAGLSKAMIGQKNNFTVDCSKAGTNMLMVGVHGPQAPCEEVYVKHMGNKLYNVTYTVKDKGSYTVISLYPKITRPLFRLSLHPPPSAFTYHVHASKYPERCSPVDPTLLKHLITVLLMKQ